MAASSGLRTPLSSALLTHAQRSTSAGLARPRRRRAACSVTRPAGQRAGLVAAQHVHGAQVLDRRQALDDHLALRHALSTLAQRDGHDHRQELGGQTDRQRQREQQRFERVVVQQGADQEHEQHQADDGAHDEQAEAARAALVLGRRCLLHQRVGDRAKLGAARQSRSPAPGRRRSRPRCRRRAGRPRPSPTRFSTGSDSPVSAASSTLSVTAVSSVASAGSRSPARSSSRSPGTTSRTGISVELAVAPDAGGRARPGSGACGPPARSGRSGRSRGRRSAATMVTMMAALSASPRRPETTLATSRIRTSGLVANWSTGRSAQKRCPVSTSFGP